MKRHNEVARKFNEGAGRKSDPSAKPNPDAGCMSDPEGVGITDHLYVPPKHGDFTKDQLIFWNITTDLLVTNPSGNEERFKIAFSSTPNAWGAVWRRAVIWSPSITEYTPQQLSLMIHHEHIHDDVINPPMFVHHGAGDYCTPCEGQPFVTFLQRVHVNATSDDAKIMKINKKVADC